MADPIRFTHRHVIEALLLSKGIKEGHWSLGITMGFTAITAGDPSKPDDRYPSGVVSVLGFELKEEQPGAEGVVVDAAAIAVPSKPRRKATTKS